ncbi:SAM-dependent methyltransferase [Micromonospora sp. NPDC050417]|uniref:SAM-dependent methyltransferase n=1 Tax=Micromonospora sp. NPDC050417 TaxID=3364280 RepID=UPI0037B84504
MELPEERPWTPEEGDPSGPNLARVYNALGGGTHTFGADREMANRLLAVQPEVAYWVRTNREFLARSARFLFETGLRQVLDVGAGLLAPGSVHEVAAAVAPDARVVYLDLDPVVVAQANDVLRDRPRVTALRGDLRDPAEVLRLAVEGGLDLARPVAILLVAVLHFVQDAEDPGDILARLRDAVPTGSYVVISHASPPPQNSAEGVQAKKEYSERTAPVVLRTREQVERLFAGWELLEPGIVQPSFWRPESDELVEPAEIERAKGTPAWVGVAIKR